MQDKIPSILIGLVLVVITGAFVYWQKENSLVVTPTVTEIPQSSTTTTAIATTTVSTPSPTPKPTPTPVPPPVKSGISSTEVANHNSRQSCWTTIDSGVYDLTSWIPQHPGGEQAILQLCGTNGSVKFHTQHGSGQKFLTILMGFKIGAALP